MYSKLGGCLGVTAKLGPLARTDLCAGVKGLLERLMTHLGLGSSLEEPWLDLLGVWRRGYLPWQMPGRVPSALPACPGGVITMPCLGCPRGVISYWWRIGLGRIVFFPCSSGIRLRGRAISFWGKVYSSWERIASFPGRKVSNSRCLVEGGNLTVYLVVYWITWITCIICITCIIIVASLAVKGTVTLQWKVDSCWGRVVSFPRRKESRGQGRVAGARRGLNLPV